MRKPCAAGCGKLLAVSASSLPEPVCWDCRRQRRTGSRHGLTVEALRVPPEPGYYVYELWGAEGCLYVGRVGNNGPGSARKRLKNHRSAQTWWSQVTRAVVDALSGHEEIVAEEARRISELRPVHNRQLTTGVRWLLDVRDRDDAYQEVYRQRPERILAERARENGKRGDYYAERNALPEVKERKRRWAMRTGRRPGAGQAVMF